MGVTQRLGTIPLAIQTDSSNNVGIGGAANSSYKLAVTGNTTITGNLGIGGGANERLTITGPSGLAGMARWTDATTGSGFLGFTSGGTAYIHSNSNALSFGANGSNNFAATMTLTSGNVGIGTSTPDNLLDLYGTGTNTTRIRVRGTTNFALFQAQNDSSSALYMGIDSSTASGFNVGNYSRIIWSGGAYPLVFATNDVQRMSITANGNVLMNTTNVLSAGWLCVSVPSSNYNAIVLRDTGTQYSGDNFYQIFTNSSNTLAGSISHNTATTIGFNTSSDYRLKEDFKDFNGLDLLSNIKFYDFKWKEEDKRMHGVIAHELETIIPLAVSGKKDAVDKEGNIVAQGVDYSKIVPIIGKALQEAMAKIEELNAKVTALENK